MCQHSLKLVVFPSNISFIEKYAFYFVWLTIMKLHLVCADGFFYNSKVKCPFQVFYYPWSASKVNATSHLTNCYKDKLHALCTFHCGEYVQHVLSQDVYVCSYVTAVEEVLEY